MCHVMLCARGRQGSCLRLLRILFGKEERNKVVDSLSVLDPALQVKALGRLEGNSDFGSCEADGFCGSLKSA